MKREQHTGDVEYNVADCSYSGTARWAILTGQLTGNIRYERGLARTFEVHEAASRDGNTLGVRKF